MRPCLAVVLAVVFACAGGADIATAQSRKPTAKETAVVRACIDKHRDNSLEVERHCLFALVADRCQKRPAGRSTHGSADCYRVEEAIWDDLLDASRKALDEELDADGKEKLRAMQSAWIASRDATCDFFYDRIQGSMAVPMIAACRAREAARRALLLDALRRL